MKKINSHERGQILVLLALVLIGLLGFTALAVDGGMIYADRRYMQSAGDAASLAGAGAVANAVQSANLTSANFKCNDMGSGITAGYSVAIDKAATNDFTIAQNSDLGTNNNDNGVNITCNEEGKFIDVFVMLTRNTTTSFVHLFTGNPMRNTITSITRVKPGINAGDGSAIVSLSKDCHANADGIWISGTNETFLLNGGLWSNSCIERNGNAEIDITNGSVDYFHDSYVTGITNPIPSPQMDYHPLTYIELEPAVKDACDQLTDSYDDLQLLHLSGTETEKVINPGRYGDWDFNVPVKLKAGLYCISGTVSMNSDGYIFGEPQPGGNGDGVTIFYTGTSLTINGGAQTNLAAPNGYDYPDAPPSGAFEDILLYIPPGVEAVVKINGNSENFIAGTLYMPSSAVTINGTSDATAKDDQTLRTKMETSIIGYSVKINGTSYLDIKYNADRDRGMTSYLQIQK
ncbi:MAG TPA: Tad domain-containing protein [Bellilinea sp.]|nr:Tad domain-containing protein [Bellilinea sp.]